MKKKFKISDAQNGHCYGRCRGDDPVAAVRRLLAAAGYADCDYELEVVHRPRLETELMVSRKGEDMTFVIIREPNASSGRQSGQVARVV